MMVMMMRDAAPAQHRFRIAQGRTSSLSIADSVFANNAGQAFGGAWSGYDTHTIAITNCMFSNNSAAVGANLSPLGQTTPPMGAR